MTRDHVAILRLLLISRVCQRMAVVVPEAAVPDIGTEVEISCKRRKTAPKSAPKKANKQRSLRKKEKKAVIGAISEADINDLVAAVLQQVDNEQHLRFFPERSEIWEKLKISNLFQTMCECFKKLYSSIYADYSTGSDKFQFKWYQQCSSMLKDSTSNRIEYHSSLSEAVSKWIEFKNTNSGHSSFHLNCVLISVQGAIFRHLAKWVAQEISTATSGSMSPSTTTTVEEPDDVYYRFGGAAIAEMLHNRYRSIHGSPYSKRSKIVTEITILKSMECKDKSVIPASLQYRDRGFMYFPDSSLIPFIKAVDNKVRSIAHNDGIKQHGKNIIAVASEEVKADKSLQEHFVRIIASKFDCLDGMMESVNFVYSEFTRKLYNTRLAEFIDCYRQTQAAKKGSATLSGQNLRDTLLCQHATLKSTDLIVDLPNPSCFCKTFATSQ